MTSPQKRKGHAAERAVVKYLREHGFKADRIQAGTHKDVGDISGIPGVVFEVKDRKQHNWSEYFEQLHSQLMNADAYAGALVIKRPGVTDPRGWIAAMEFHEFVRLIGLLEDKNNGI